MTNWAKTNQNMANFRTSMQNIYKMRQTTAENKAESAEDTKKAIKGVYDDEFKRITDLVGYYDKLIKDSKEGGIYGKEEADITEWSNNRSFAMNKKLALLENGVNLINPETMQVEYGEDTRAIDITTTGLGTQLKQKESLDMAVDFFKAGKAMDVDKRSQMLREFRHVEKDLTRLRVKKAKSDAWDANDIIFKGGNKKTDEVYQEWLRLDQANRKGQLKTEADKLRFENLTAMKKGNLVFNDKNEPVSVNSLFPNYTKIKGTHKDDKPEAFTDGDTDEAMVYNNIAQNVVRLNDPSLSEEQITKLNFLDLNANTEEMQAYLDLIFNNEVAGKLNSILNEFEKAMKERE
jgi:hypothetical protein